MSLFEAKRKLRSAMNAARYEREVESKGVGTTPIEGDTPNVVAMRAMWTSGKPEIGEDPRHTRAIETARGMVKEERERARRKAQPKARER